VRAICGVLAIAGTVATLGLPPSTVAATGGAAAPGNARITAIHCLPTGQRPCAARNVLSPGGHVRVRGRELDRSRMLVFRGRAGRRDDAVARVRHVRPGHFEAVVPAGALSGRVEVVTNLGGRARAPRRVRVAVPAPAPQESLSGDTYFAGEARRPTFTTTPSQPGNVELVRDETGVVVRTWALEASAGPVTVTWDGQDAEGPAPPGRYTFRLANGPQAAAAGSATRSIAYYDHIFPIRGAHDLGQSATNNFGGARGHKGQDMFARCSTPLVAARGGSVRYAGFHSQAGYYVVVTSPETGLDYVYMHMRSTARVKTRDLVATGQPIGEVGDSGNASGCHVHFELWSAPGWYMGGSAIDPLPRLRAWDTWS